MTPERKKHVKPSISTISRRCLVCGVVLAAGIATMSVLASMKSPPTEAGSLERPLKIEALVAEPESVCIHMKGHGTVRALNRVKIASKVSGNVVAIHPGLEKGEIIKKEDVLFKIDHRRYQAAYEEALAIVKQLENRVDRLKREYAAYRRRLKTLARNKELAKDQFERIQRLLNSHQIGTRSELDRAEQEFNAGTDIYDEMMLKISVFPFQIGEAENDLHAARARRDAALVDLEHCTVRAPFTCRVKDVALEQCQYVEPGREVLTLSDDSILEIQIPLDSRDAGAWLQFNKDKESDYNGWFDDLKKVACSVRWTEDKRDRYHEAILHRIVKFDETTRTITVAVRMVDSAKSASDGHLPLVEGMFCEVTIPGRVLTNMIKLPAHAVSFENTVFVSVADRLKTVNVTVAWAQEEQVYVSSGLNPGDRVIITRLIDPLENALLEVTESGSTASLMMGDG
jgi:multidrug efflux pump subunit AcrA (membrane-fusion protein)